jgi:aminoglycoside phosphotransferase (APT) family kinase protein
VIRVRENPETVLAMINRRHGTAMRMVGPAPGGDTGAASVVADPAGRRMLLKGGAGPEFRAADAAAIVARLKAAGYPVEEFLYWGVDGAISYTVRPWVEGRPLGAELPHHLGRVLALNDLHAGAAPGLPTGFRETLVASVLEGFGDWCVLDSLRNHSARSAALLAELQGIVRRCERAALRAHDAVHFDFHHGNILVDDRGIAAVIDWEGCRAGDRAFDLATLLYYSYPDPALRRVLWERAREIASYEAMALFLAHMIVRQTEWSIRLEAPAAGERYLNLADVILSDLRERRV